MDTRTRLRSRPAPRERLTFAWDIADATRIAQAEDAAELAAAEAAAHSKSATARKEQADAARAAAKLRAEVLTVTVTLEAIGASAWEQLVLDHPPSDEQVERGRTIAEAAGLTGLDALPQFDPATFRPAVFAAMCRRIEFSDDPDGAIDAPDRDTCDDLWSQLSEGDQMFVTVTCAALNQRPSRVESLGKD